MSSSPIPSVSGRAADLSRLLQILRAVLPLGRELVYECADLYVQHHNEIAAHSATLPLACDTINNLIVALCQYKDQQQHVTAQQEEDIFHSYQHDEEGPSNLLKVVHACSSKKARLFPRTYEALICRSADDHDWRGLVYTVSMVSRKNITCNALSACSRLVLESPDLMVEGAKHFFKMEACAYFVSVLTRFQSQLLPGTGTGVLPITSATAAAAQDLIRRVAAVCQLQQHLDSCIDLAALCCQHNADNRTCTVDLKEIIVAVVQSCIKGNKGSSGSLASHRLAQQVDVPAIVCFLENNKEACSAILLGQPLIQAAREGLSTVLSIKKLAPRDDTYVMIGDKSLLLEMAQRAEVQIAVTDLMSKYDATEAGARLIIPSEALAEIYDDRQVSGQVKEAASQLVERWVLRGVRWVHIAPLSMFSAICQSLHAESSSAPLVGGAACVHFVKVAKTCHSKVALFTASSSVQQYAKETLGTGAGIILLGELLRRLGGGR